MSVGRITVLAFNRLMLLRWTFLWVALVAGGCGDNVLQVQGVDRVEPDAGIADSAIVDGSTTGEALDSGWVDGSSGQDGATDADIASDAGSPRPDAGRGDAGHADAGHADAGQGDAGDPLPLFPDLEIGPYRARDMLVRTLRRQGSVLDVRSNYQRTAGTAYFLQAVGELLWAARDHALPEREELIDLALEQVRRLESQADRTNGAAPAFGLDRTFDAFGDGSTNPAFTAYTYQSGMVALGVAKVARVLRYHAHPAATETRGFAVRLVNSWDRYFSTVSGGGYWWYSKRSSDAIAVHNTSSLIAMAGQLLLEDGARLNQPTRPRLAADLLRNRISGNPTAGYSWNYADDGIERAQRKPEDVSHALITLQFMRFSADRGWWPASYMRGVAATINKTIWTGHPARLSGRVDGTRAGDAEWNWTRSAAIGVAAHGNSLGGDPLVFDRARSILFSSYLSRFAINPATGTTSSTQALALAHLLSRRPAPFSDGRPWVVTAGEQGDNAPPTTLTARGNVRFYNADWGPPRQISSGLTLPSRLASAANANLCVDLHSRVTGRVVVSLVYRALRGGAVQQWNGTRYQTLASLPATLDEEGTVRWMRTSFELTTDRFDHQRSVLGINVLLQLTEPSIAVHQIEATNL